MTAKPVRAEPVYGYVQLPLVGRNRDRVEERIRVQAAGFGSELKRMFAEPSPPVDVLWSLFVGVDRLLEGQALPALFQLAHQRGVDVRRLIGWARRATAPLAWEMLLAELRRVGGGWVIVPGPEHLDGLAESRSVLLHTLSRTHPLVRVQYLTDPTDCVTGSPPSQAPRTEVFSALVGEFRVKAFGAAVEVASLRAWSYLSEAKLTYLVADVEAVLRVLIGARIPALPVAELDDMRIRLLRTGRTLLIDVQESESHADEPVPFEVRRRCSRVARYASAAGGGTVTWCELPLADPGTAGLADAVHRHHRITTPPAIGGEGH